MYLITGIACTFNPTSGRSITSAGVVLQAIRDPLNPGDHGSGRDRYTRAAATSLSDRCSVRSLCRIGLPDSVMEVITSGLPAKSFNPAVGVQVILPVPPAVALAEARLVVGAEHDRDRVAANRHRRGSPGGAEADGPDP